MNSIGNIMIGIGVIYFLVSFLMGSIATRHLDHLSANGVLICKDANSTFTVTADDIMETTDRYHLHLKPHGQKINYFACEKKITKNN